MATTKNIQSLERAFAILELFAGGKKELSLGEISQRLGVGKSTCFGLANTLCNLGYLNRDEGRKAYRLGLKILSLASSVQENSILAQIVHPHLVKITKAFGETTHSAVGEENGVVYIDKVEADGSIVINSRIGVKNDLHCTGVGKCILAWQPEEYLRELYAKPVKAHTKKTITDLRRMRRELTAVREFGYAVDDEEFETGLVCYAVPIFDKTGVTAAISISGPASRMLGAKRDEMVRKLGTSAGEISKELRRQK